MSEEQVGQTLGSLLNFGATRAPISDQGEAGEDTTPEGLRARIASMQERIEELKASTEAEVLKAWQSPWKGADAVKAKVDARLASNPEFRGIMNRLRDAEIALRELEPQAPPAPNFAGPSHPAMGR